MPPYPFDGELLNGAQEFGLRRHRQLGHFVEQGLPGYVVEAWFGVLGPKGMSAADVKRVHDAVVAAFRPDVLIVDNVPRGACGELELALARLRREGQTHCVLGLRDWRSELRRAEAGLS